MVKLIFLVAIFGFSAALDAVNWSKTSPNNAYVPYFTDAPYIVNGWESQPNSRPYQVALIIDGMYLCGGSLISTNYVLTAAHCIKGFSKIQVILGAHNLKKEEPTRQIVESTTYIVHPDFNTINLNNDIGLIKLPEAITLNEHIQTIALAETGDFVGAKATASGWGDLSDAGGNSNNTLHEVDLDVVKNEICKQYYGPDLVKDFTLCTSGMGTVGLCFGDSGGPLVLEKKLIGVNSFVSGAGCEAGHPSGYTRVTALRPWILENSDLKN